MATGAGFVYPRLYIKDIPHGIQIRRCWILLNIFVLVNAENDSDVLLDHVWSHSEERFPLDFLVCFLY